MAFLDWLKRLLGGSEPGTGPERSPFAAGTGPARLLVMRHAEKTGDKRDRSLSEAGWARAESLVRYIPETFGKPDFLIAAESGKKSDRPYDTLAPLAKALDLDIWDELDDEEVDALIDALATTREWQGKFGVISWRHSDLPRLIAALGAPSGSYPEEWGRSVYDLMFDVSYTGAGAPSVRAIRQSS